MTAIFYFFSGHCLLRCSPCNYSLNETLCLCVTNFPVFVIKCCKRRGGGGGGEREEAEEEGEKEGRKGGGEEIK